MASTVNGFAGIVGILPVIHAKPKSRPVRGKALSIFLPFSMIPLNIRGRAFAHTHKPSRRAGLAQGQKAYCKKACYFCNSLHICVTH